MNTEENQPKPPSKLSKLYRILAGILATLFFIVMKMYEYKVEHDPELERVRQEFLEQAQQYWSEYAKEEYLRDSVLYWESIDSISAADSLEKLTNQR